MSANKLNTTTYNAVAANTVADAVIDAPSILAWRQDVQAVVNQHADEINAVNPNKVTTKSANATLVTTDAGVIEVTAAADVTITLPTAATTGLRYNIKKVDAGTGKVTVATTSSQTIDGVASRVLNFQYDFIQVVSNGSNWDIVGRNTKGEAWIAPTLLNSWVGYDAAHTPGYFKTDSGLILTKGSVKSGTFTDGTTIFTYPVGYRPVQTLDFGVLAYNVTSRVLVEIGINTTGSVQLYAAAANTLVSFDNFPQFRAEN